MSNVTGIQPPPKPADRGNQRAAKHSLYVKSPNGLRLRYRRVRRLVRKMQNVMPWLDPADDPACRAWAEMEILGAYAFTDLMERGLTNKKGDPRRLLGEFRQLRQAQLAYERDLGMTPAARMALKVGNSRAKALAGDDSGVGADVAELEGRIMDRLQEGGGGTSTLAPTPSSEEGAASSEGLP